MNDFDFLVPLDQGERAVELLGLWGWQPGYETSRIFNPVFHGMNFYNSEGHGADLHWHALNRCCRPGDDDEFWARSLPIEFQGFKTRILHPTDQLIHLCVHGMSWNSVPPIRWVADSATLLKNSSSQIDWEGLKAHAKKLFLTLPMKDALAYLQERFSAPVPTHVLKDLETAMIEPWERFEHEGELRSQKWFGQFFVLWRRYPRSQQSEVYRWKPLGFANYLQQYLGFEDWWRVPPFLVRKFIGKLRNNLSGPQ